MRDDKELQIPMKGGGSKVALNAIECGFRAVHGDGPHKEGVQPPLGPGGYGI